MRASGLHFAAQHLDLGAHVLRVGIEEGDIRSTWSACAHCRMAATKLVALAGERIDLFCAAANMRFSCSNWACKAAVSGVLYCGFEGYR
ncbi:MAG: hypothetical protein R2818_04750 [Flavobacteriales bacterium]